jgi:phenol hydroxylase P0 protein
MMGDVTTLEPRGGLAEAERYVRVTSTARPGLVEFQFSIGDPGLYLEMILPQHAFDEFCSRNAVTRLSEDQAQAVDAGESVWQYGDESREE